MERRRYGENLSARRSLHGILISSAFQGGYPELSGVEGSSHRELSGVCGGGRRDALPYFGKFATGAIRTYPELGWGKMGTRGIRPSGLCETGKAEKLGDSWNSPWHGPESKECWSS